MTTLSCALLAVLSLWDYPARQPRHTELSSQFIAAVRAGDTATMEKTARAGVQLLPDDPTWQYNLACALARGKHRREAFDALDKAIRIGFRRPDEIAGDGDWAELRSDKRFAELLAYAREKQDQPILSGPLAVVPAKGVFGSPLALGEQNLQWNFDLGCFEALIDWSDHAIQGGNAGDLYFNRDGGHSVIDLAAHPGLTRVGFDAEGRRRGADLDFPNLLADRPLFGNCSRAMTVGPFWRSIPRALTTSDAWRLKTQYALYRANQFWVFPANADIAPVGTNGDVFASITPYWLTTAGRSWSDKYYVDAALSASAAMPRATKEALIERGMLAPTLQLLIRQSLKTVVSPADYLTAKAHPTAFPPNGLDRGRLLAMAGALKPLDVPPLAQIAGIAVGKTGYRGNLPEITYATPCAWALTLRGDEDERQYFIKAAGGIDYHFAQTHGADGSAKIEKLAAAAAKITVYPHLMSSTGRVDIAIFAKGPNTGWSAPAFVSFAVGTGEGYVDPVLFPPAGADSPGDIPQP